MRTYKESGKEFTPEEDDNKASCIWAFLSKFDIAVIKEKNWKQIVRGSAQWYGLNYLCACIAAVMKKMQNKD